MRFHQTTKKDEMEEANRNTDPPPPGQSQGQGQLSAPAESNNAEAPILPLRIRVLSPEAQAQALINSSLNQPPTVQTPQQIPVAQQSRAIPIAVRLSTPGGPATPRRNTAVRQSGPARFRPTLASPSPRQVNVVVRAQGNVPVQISNDQPVAGAVIRPPVIVYSSPEAVPLINTATYTVRSPVFIRPPVLTASPQAGPVPVPNGPVPVTIGQTSPDSILDRSVSSLAREIAENLENISPPAPAVPVVTSSPTSTTSGLFSSSISALFTASPTETSQNGTTPSSSTSTVDWRAGKNLNQIMEYVLDHDEDSKKDVTFLVGEEKEEISAHRLVLGLVSTVFDRVLYNPSINFTGHLYIAMSDVKPYAFRKLLRYIYVREVEVGLEEGMDMLRLSTRFNLPELSSRCMSMLRMGINDENVCAILKAATEINEQRLKEISMNHLQINAKKILLSDGFAELPRQCVMELFASDNLNAEEITVFFAAIRWGEEEHKRSAGVASGEDVKVSGEQLRVALGDLIYGIRFPLMSPAEFAVQVAQRKILALEDSMNLFIYFNSPIEMKPDPAPFSKEKRSRGTTVAVATSTSSPSPSETGEQQAGEVEEVTNHNNQVGDGGGGSEQVPVVNTNETSDNEMDLGEGEGQGGSDDSPQPPSDNEEREAEVKGEEKESEMEVNIDEGGGGEVNTNSNSDIETEVINLMSGSNSPASADGGDGGEGASNSNSSSSVSNTSIHSRVVTPSPSASSDGASPAKKKRKISSNHSNVSEESSENIEMEEETEEQEQERFSGYDARKNPKKDDMLNEFQSDYIAKNFGDTGNNLVNFFTRIEYTMEENAHELVNILEDDPVVINAGPTVLAMLELPYLKSFTVDYLHLSKNVGQFKKYLSSLMLSNSLLFFKAVLEDETLLGLWVSNINVNVTVNGVTVIKIYHDQEESLTISRVKASAPSILEGLALNPFVKKVHLEEIKIESLDQIPTEHLEMLTLRKVTGIKNRGEYLRKCKNLVEFSCCAMGDETLDLGIDLGFLDAREIKLRRLALGKARLHCSKPVGKLGNSLEELYLDNCTLTPELVEGLPLVFPALKRVKMCRNVSAKIFLQFMAIDTLEWIAVWELPLKPLTSKGTPKKKKGAPKKNVPEGGDEILDMFGVKKFLEGVDFGADSFSKWGYDEVTLILERSKVTVSHGSQPGTSGTGRESQGAQEGALGGWKGRKLMTGYNGEKYVEFTKLDYEQFNWTMFYTDYHLFHKINSN